MNRLIAFLVLVFAGCFFTVHAEVTKTVCISTFGQTQSEIKNKLLTLAKRAAVEELFGSFIQSFTKVKNFSLQQDEIETYSVGFIRIKGSPVYSQGNNFGEVCIKITAHITQEDWEKIQPKELSKKTCELEGDIKTIKKRTEKKAKLEALFDYDQALREYPPKKVLPLLREVKFSEGDFVSGTPVYCIRATGLLYPIEITALKSQKTTKPIAQFVQGLKGEYFNLPPLKENTPPGEFPKQPIFIRIDKLIDFNWNEGIPAPNVSANYFGVRWTGMIHIPITGSYFFYGVYNAGMRLFIDDKLVIDRWRYNAHPGIEGLKIDDTSYRRENIEGKGDVFLEGDKWHSIRIEFFEARSLSYIRLHWRMPGTGVTEVISSSYLRTEEK